MGVLTQHMAAGELEAFADSGWPNREACCHWPALYCCECGVSFRPLVMTRRPSSRGGTR
jgi:hypothetical protein